MNNEMVSDYIVIQDHEQVVHVINFVLMIMFEGTDQWKMIVINENGLIK